ncbi:hypothetical protein F4859DRAFT_480403 [Xylaria cf. heliscus]|nr:hypothetical protein F4859DRAFT_480403 [Xylaria cf. heliscus]
MLRETLAVLCQVSGFGNACNLQNIIGDLCDHGVTMTLCSDVMTSPKLGQSAMSCCGLPSWSIGLFNKRCIKVIIYTQGIRQHGVSGPDYLKS